MNRQDGRDMRCGIINIFLLEKSFGRETITVMDNRCTIEYYNRNNWYKNYE